MYFMFFFIRLFCFCCITKGLAATKSPFDFAPPNEPVLNLLVHANESTSRLRSQSAFQVPMHQFVEQKSVDETSDNIYIDIPINHKTGFYDFLSLLKGAVKSNAHMHWLRIKANDTSAAIMLKNMAIKEQTLQKKLFDLSCCLFKQRSLPLERWRFAVRQVVKQLKEKADEMTSDAFKIDEQRGYTKVPSRKSLQHHVLLKQQAWQKIKSSSLDHFTIRAAETKEKGSMLQRLEHTKRQEQKEELSQRPGFWKNFLQKHQNDDSPLYLDSQHPLLSPAPYNTFHTIELVNVDYEVIDPLVYLFSGTERLKVDNTNLAPLQKRVQLVFEGYDKLYHLNLSHDDSLFVRDYRCICKNYPGNNSLKTKRKVIAGPLYANRVNGDTAVPAGHHPLLFDNYGIAEYLGERTQRFFSTMPGQNNFVKIEFFGQNTVTAIDFGERPVSSSVLESLLQAQIDRTFDPAASWDERLAWSNKFSVIEYLDLSGTNIHDLTVVRNLKRLDTIILNDTALGDAEDSRYLPRLKHIQFSFQPYSLARANLGFVKMNFLNFLKIKHSFLPIIAFFFGVAVVTLDETIKALVNTVIK